MSRRIIPVTGRGLTALLAPLLLALTVAAGFSSRPTRAAELLMFDEPGCIWCQRWHERIGPAYPNTEEGRIAPLRVLPRHGRLPAAYKLKKAVVLTPTFVLVDDAGREVDRITGYPPEEFFWSLLGEMLARLPSPTTSPQPRQISIRR